MMKSWVTAFANPTHI